MQVAEKHHTDWNRARLWSAAAWPVLLLVIVVGFFWKLLLTNQYTWLDSPDYAYQVLPWYQFQAGEWHQGRFPLWDPYLWGGQPLVGQLITGAVYPPNWLLFLAPLRHGWIRQSYMHWYFVLIHFPDSKGRTAKDADAFLTKRGLILRYGTPAEGLGRGPSFRLRPVAEGAP
jgi:hypothetical protein